MTNQAREVNGLANPTRGYPEAQAVDEQLHLGEDDALVVLRQAWEKSLELLAPEVNRPSFESFFRTARPISVDGAMVTIGAASELARIFLQKYSELVKTALEANLDAEVEINFVVAPQKPKSKAEPAPQKESARQPAAGTISQISEPLNEKYDFKSFIVGPCNRLAHAACMAVAKRPGKTYNPLFLYGGSGLGKTHLLQAIAHNVLTAHPGRQVAYLSAETFTFQYVSALRDHRSEEFRRKHRGIDVWLIDDVQFLAAKERTKEEFFHTFNELLQTGKQIVISSDRAPRDMHPIEERLRSRFESGLVADLAPPDFETRLAILQKKAQAEEAEVPNEVLLEVANLIQTNIRALEGALVTLIAYGSLMKTRLTPATAQEIIHRYLIEKKCAELTLDAVQRVTAQRFDLSIEDLVGSARRKELVTPRHVAMHLCRELTGFPLAAIGKAFGGRDHATVVHACNRIKKLLDEDESLKQVVEQLADDLRAGRY